MIRLSGKKKKTIDNRLIVRKIYLLFRDRDKLQLLGYYLQHNTEKQITKKCFSIFAAVFPQHWYWQIVPTRTNRVF